MASSDVVLSFDHPRNLEISVHFGERIAIVDVIKSLQLDPCNVSHPLIANAISYYSLGVRYSFQALPKNLLAIADEKPNDQMSLPGLDCLAQQRITKKQGKSNLERIFRALIYDERPTLTANLIWLADLAALKYPPSYFDRLFQLIEDPRVAKLRRPQLKTAKISAGLDTIFPGTDNSTIQQFLCEMFAGRRGFRLPQSSNKKSAGAALRDTFVAWLAHSNPQTVKTYLSKARRPQDGGMVSQDQVSHMVEDVVHSMVNVWVLPHDLRNKTILDLSSLFIKSVTVNK